MRSPKSRARVSVRPFGELPDGRAVSLYTLTNDHIEMRAITLGAIVTALVTPDRWGNPGDIVLGHATLPPYLDNPAYLGAVVGRYANRIGRARFTLDGIAYEVAANDGINHLHGGWRGFDTHLWTATAVAWPEAVGVTFERTSANGEEHYPGTLHVQVTYALTSSNTVVLSYSATTDAPTIVNLTQHSYFNLGDVAACPTVLGHQLRIAADAYIPIDSGLIPIGDPSTVEATPFDFREGAALGARLLADEEQLKRASGLDHTFVLSPVTSRFSPIAELYEPSSGRRLEIATTEPGVHVYAGQLLNGDGVSASGRVLAPHAGVCLETQHFPDSPNRPQFPSVVLRPGQQYESTTMWRFTAD